VQIIAPLAHLATQAIVQLAHLATQRPLERVDVLAKMRERVGSFDVHRELSVDPTIVVLMAGRDPPFSCNSACAIAV